MMKSIFAAGAATLLLAGSVQAGQETLLLAQATVTGNITQNQSGWGNSQSISIGNTDSKPAPKKGRKGEKISSTQEDPETGNRQSANVNGSARLRQNQDGKGNTQSADVDGSGNITQNQSGRNNAQSIVIGGGASVGGTPSVTQSQTGANRKQSIKIDGKKVETRAE